MYCGHNNQTYIDKLDVNICYDCGLEIDSHVESLSAQTNDYFGSNYTRRRKCAPFNIFNSTHFSVIPMRDKEQVERIYFNFFGGKIFRGKNKRLMIKLILTSFYRRG